VKVLCRSRGREAAHEAVDGLLWRTLAQVLGGAVAIGSLVPTLHGTRPGAWAGMRWARGGCRMSCSAWCSTCCVISR
jgi:hypothetical protein